MKSPVRARCSIPAALMPVDRAGGMTSAFAPAMRITCRVAAATVSGMPPAGIVPASAAETMPPAIARTVPAAAPRVPAPAGPMSSSAARTVPAAAAGAMSFIAAPPMPAAARTVRPAGVASSRIAPMPPMSAGGPVVSDGNRRRIPEIKAPLHAALLDAFPQPLDPFARGDRAGRRTGLGVLVREMLLGFLVLLEYRPYLLVAEVLPHEADLVATSVGSPLGDFLRFSQSLSTLDAEIPHLPVLFLRRQPHPLLGSLPQAHETLPDLGFQPQLPGGDVVIAVAHRALDGSMVPVGRELRRLPWGREFSVGRVSFVPPVALPRALGRAQEDQRPRQEQRTSHHPMGPDFISFRDARGLHVPPPAVQPRFPWTSGSRPPG